LVCNKVRELLLQSKVCGTLPDFSILFFMLKKQLDVFAEGYLPLLYIFHATGAAAEFASAQSSFSSGKSSDIATDRAFKCHFSRA
jgi:hypothetical protein